MIRGLAQGWGGWKVRAGSRVGAMLGLFLLVVLGTVGSKAQAQSASKWNKRGLDAEVRENYDAAFEDYRQANLKAPKDMRYKARLERMRGMAAAQHVGRGRTLRQSSDYAGAITEFMRALQIDPSDQAAQQEIEQTQREQPPASPSPAGAAAAMEQMQQRSDLLRSIGSLAGPVELQPVSNDPITLHMVEDVKVIYQAVGKLAGLNVLFDPDYNSKRIPVDLTNVSLSDALRIIGTISGTFYKPITANTIFIAQNTRTKRTDLDEMAVQTFYLSNSSQASDGNEVQTAVRNLLDPSTKIYLVPSQNALVLRATPDQLLLAQKIINDLDRAKAEVVVDVAVLEVNRDRIRNLGITLPQSIGLTPQASNANVNNSSSGSSSTNDGTTNTTTNTSGLTLNNLAHLNATNFAVSITGGTLNALLTDTDTRILQNPRIRSSDGQRATLKIGSKIPVATGSYSSTLSTSASLGVQTQFTYLDVGVNIDLTPTVHYDREITLKLKIEVSSESGTQTISGVTEPIISQRVSEQTIQLKEGEPSILAGLLTRQDNNNVSGTPGLGELPFFKFFFASQNKEVQRDEIVFLLIPHIVRESVLTRANTGAIDTGTGQAIELRRSAVANTGVLPGNTVGENVTPSAQRPVGSVTAADAAAAMLPGTKALSRNNPAAPVAVAPPSSAAGAAAAAIGTAPGAQPVSFGVTPANSSQGVGSTFQVAVTLDHGRDVFSVPLQMQFDPKVLQLVNVDAGGFLAKGNQPVSIVHRDEGNGLVTISTSRPPNTPGVTGDGSVCTLTFKAVGAGDSNITLVKVGARDSAQASLPAVGSQAVVHVK
ncbi:type II and III secretion system protein [Granulicella sp. WH15]|uniref:cohesin domain-containing protein n=1 Tax=Granulicella sp. WH15 TaxID=2602070 RepID=UPI001366D95D|nr:cohesin domain-containing protein [Granulicella sp. WH15]QHN03718.1 type II and III secretion system protein [Granulicella sp. WH15]